MTLHIWSPAFNDGGRIPSKYSREGEEVSPPLVWADVPDGTVEMALVCDDPDAPTDEPWVHWVVYKIAAEVTELPEGGADGAVEGLTDFEEQNYGGPMPPEGHGVHHYYFKLFALDTALDVGPGLTKAALLRSMEGHVLEDAYVVGTYER